MRGFSAKTIVWIVIGVALFYILGIISIPTPILNTYVSLQYAVESVFAALLGPVAGILIGFIGHTLIDVTTSEPWWSWIIASACVGLIVGLATLRMDISKEFDAGNIIRFNVAQLISHLLAWGIIAPCLDILIYGESIGTVFIQGLTAGIANIITTGVVGSLLLIAYVETVVKKSPLNNKED